MPVDRRIFLNTLIAGAASIPFTSALDGQSSARSGRLHNQKGIRINMIPRGMSMLDGFRMARDAGFTQMEPFATFDAKLAAETKQASETAGIHIGSVANPMNWRDPLSSNDPELGKKSIATQTAALRNAHLWGAEATLVIPGVVTPSVTYRDAWTNSRKRIEQLIPVAEKLGVVMAFEETANQSKFLLSPLEMARYIDDFKSPHVRAYFDTGNVMPVGYPQDWIHTLGHRIVKVHLKDYDPKTRKFVDLGDGTVDWAAVRQAFIDIGYEGTFTAELKAGGPAYLRDLSARIDRLLLS